VAVLGCGEIAGTAHLPAYAKHDVDVVGLWSRTSRSRELSRDQLSGRRLYDSPEDLLAEPAVSVVDVATRVEDRRRWVEAAIDRRQARPRAEGP
jgi:predicted dehydrogenase